MKRFFCAVELFILFFHEMIVCNFEVLVRIFRSNKTLSPAIICMPLQTKKPTGLWLLSLIISITPGSLIVEIEEEKGHLYVHLFHAPNPEKWVQHMRDRFEQRIRILVGEQRGNA